MLHFQTLSYQTYRYTTWLSSALLGLMVMLIAGCTSHLPEAPQVPPQACASNTRISLNRTLDSHSLPITPIYLGTVILSGYVSMAKSLPHTNSSLTRRVLLNIHLLAKSRPMA